MTEEFTRVETDKILAPCPLCGSPTELWKYAANPSAPLRYSVMCTYTQPIGPERDADEYESLVSGCVFYMPVGKFYRPTKREAVKFWNEWAAAVAHIRDVVNGVANND